MKTRFKSVLAGAGAIAIAGGMLLATGGVALAQTPGYEPDNTATLGGIDFFDSSGNQITSGTVGALTSTPFAAYAVVQDQAPTTVNHKATLFAATPNSGRVNPIGTGFTNTFNNEQLSSSTVFPIAAPPANIAGVTNPVVTGLATDKSLAQYFLDLPNTDTSATDGFGNLYQLRVKVSETTGYAAASILITGTGPTATWAQVSGSYRLFPDTTTTTLTATPPSPSVPGTNVTLHAVVADTTTSATSPVGSVSFYDGAAIPGNLIGAAQPVVAGAASVSTSTLSTAVHTLTAVFTPTDPTLFGTSTGTTPYTLANLDASNTALSVNPTTGPAFTAVDLTATVTDTTPPGTAIPTGSVQFFDGATAIGSPVALAAGVAVLHDTAGFTFAAPGPTHSITAQYLGSATIAGSTSAAVVFTASAALCPGCTEPQTVEATVAAGTITITTPYNPQNPLNLGTFVLNGAGTSLSASGAFGFTTSGTAGEIFVTDTRAGDPNWTASVQSGNFTSPSSPTTPIDGQNAGLTGLTVVPVSGNALTAANVTVANNPPGTAPIVAGGTQGIGGAKHTFAQTTAGGDGSVGFVGTFTLNAPTSTGAGLYTGTVTFTVG
jgi:Bacterial Ig-like domain (group 3)